MCCVLSCVWVTWKLIKILCRCENTKWFLVFQMLIVTDSWWLKGKRKIGFENNTNKGWLRNFDYKWKKKKKNSFGKSSSQYWLCFNRKWRLVLHHENVRRGATGTQRNVMGLTARFVARLLDAGPGCYGLLGDATACGELLVLVETLHSPRLGASAAGSWALREILVWLDRFSWSFFTSSSRSCKLSTTLWLFYLFCLGGSVCVACCFCVWFCVVVNVVGAFCCCCCCFVKCVVDVG